MPKNHRTFSKYDFIVEEGRQDIYNWSERRERKYKGFRKSLNVFRIFAFNTDLLRSFYENFNFMVALQMALAGLVTYGCKTLDIVYDIHVSLFISPIVFPLAFSINTDFQRREKVLEDLALFKSSAMMWLFCMRDWREACCHDDTFMNAVGNKIKGLLFHLREYLLTEKLDRRKFIAKVIYEDLSDANQLNERVRSSTMNANSPLVSRIIHFLNMMCLSYERLRVIREYRSPRSIRSFTKVLIFVLPILLSPYYVHLGSRDNNSWSPYYIAIMVAFVFGALQGVQDKLDDPFDGMSEDDIKLDSLDEWTFQSLEATAHRSYKIGRFQVSSNPESKATPVRDKSLDEVDADAVKRKSTHFINRERLSIRDRNVPHRQPTKSPTRATRSIYSEDETKSDEFELHPYAGVLNNIKGNTTILRGGHIKKRDKSFDDLQSLNNSLTRESGKSIPFHQVIFGAGSASQRSVRSRATTPVQNRAIETFQSLFNVPTTDHVSIAMDETQLTSANIAAANLDSTHEVLQSGVASYLASQSNSVTLSRSNSRGSLRSHRSTKSSSSPKLLQVSRQLSSPVSDSDSTKPKFFIGNGTLSSYIPSTNGTSTPKSRFSVFNSSTCSTKPLLESCLSIDSENITSSDDDMIKRPCSAQDHRYNTIHQNNINYDNSRRKSYDDIPISPFHITKNEKILPHELKDGEIFI